MTPRGWLITTSALVAALVLGWPFLPKAVLGFLFASAFVCALAFLAVAFGERDDEWWLR